ncbi:tetratricopeptide repeat protein 34 isoform X3 [Saimiri boliviensis]|uniref:tetratricopeptide repeat protein 34 isoform X3 n=1 Tax=Saimiri boliviensis TaxID=27679 RepID=UPI00193D3B52|nr:tetratricopeptide repeat protein 34 isoform X2 [Saimiri boliviensis boliviensis]
MSAQELVACLCREGEQHLALGEPPLATAFYLAAFSCHAPSAVRSVRTALARAQGAAVLATLEAWCRGDSQIPAIHWDGMAVVSLTGSLASAFLGALCPDHPAAVLHLLAALLARGRHEEVVHRCNALLDSHSQQVLELRLTRALAWVLSGARAGDGVAAYLQAFASSANRTVAFIRTHQQPYLPALLSALQDYLSGHLGAGHSASQQETGGQRLLAALDPRGAWSDTLSPEALLHSGRYEDCLAACSRTLEAHPTGSGPQGELRAALLVTRAASAFFVDGRAQDVLRDLQEAFRESPSAARGQLQAVFSARDQERVRAQAQEAADVGFARFQEAVRNHPELREDADRELLAPVIRALRVLLRLAPAGARPALGIRLAECLLLAGDAASARALCERLLRPPRPEDPAGDRAGDRAPLLALRGFCALHTGDSRSALEDFQAVVEQGAPHLGGCVRALCGRGLLRVLAGSAFLGTLDYVTACRLRPEDALLAAKALVPWNQRGLLLAVLREEARGMLQRSPRLGPSRAQGRRRREAVETQGPAAQEGDARGVHQLATLLMELDAEDEASRLLAADALYRLGCLEEAHKVLLVALSRRPQAAPVLARLALLQLRRGFCYDANQLVKKLVQSGETACLQPTLDVFCLEDRQLLQGHCHARALAILRARPVGADGRAHTREAIAYLSLAIFAAGSEASESLLARARCYGFLGQKKTAMFDFNAVLRAEPGNVQALCGRALVHLALDQLQVPPRSPPGPGQAGVGDPGCCLPLPQGAREPGSPGRLHLCSEAWPRDSGPRAPLSEARSPVPHHTGPLLPLPGSSEPAGGPWGPSQGQGLPRPPCCGRGADQNRCTSTALAPPPGRRSHGTGQLRGGWHPPAEHPELCPSVRGSPGPAGPTPAQERRRARGCPGPAGPGRGGCLRPQLPAASPGDLGAAEPCPGRSPGSWHPPGHRATRAGAGLLLTVCPGWWRPCVSSASAGHLPGRAAGV